MPTVPVYFDDSITLADLTSAAKHIGCRVVADSENNISIVRPSPIVFERIDDPLPIEGIEVESLDIDIPSFLLPQAN